MKVLKPVKIEVSDELTQEIIAIFKRGEHQRETMCDLLEEDMDTTLKNEVEALFEKYGDCYIERKDVITE
jgi:hypothetical protein